jgi:sugar lactone lactonase YvrE
MIYYIAAFSWIGAQIKKYLLPQGSIVKFQKLKIAILFTACFLQSCSSVKNIQFQKVAQAQYPEGPLVVGEDLYYVEYSNHRIMKNGKVFYFHEGCGPAGLINIKDAHFLLTCYDLNSVLMISSKDNTAKLERIFTHPKLIGPNDFVLKGDSVLITASGPFDIEKTFMGALFELNLKKQKNPLNPIISDLNYPNGVAVFEELIHVSEHFSNRIAILRRAADGTWVRDGDYALPESTLWPKSRGPDGLKLDPTTNLLIVAHYGTGNIQFINLNGKIEKSLKLPFKFPTNIFLTKDHIYITGFYEESAPYDGEVLKMEK